MSERGNAERMAAGIVQLWLELQRHKSADQAASTHDLTTSQALVLRLVVHEGPQRIGALADALGVTIATASRTVDALQRAGLVRREQDASDARAVRVALTARGRREHRLRHERFVRAVAELSNGLSEVERRQLADSLETLSRLFGRDAERAAASQRRR